MTSRCSSPAGPPTTSTRCTAPAPRPRAWRAWTTLAALAQATRRLRLGTLVTGIHYRHPAVLANMAATLDVVSGGRLELGIGTGWNQQESGAYGIELGTPGERSDRFEEACQVLTGLLSPQPATTFCGRYYRLTGARCNPKPVQQPHPPNCIGGHGEQRTLRTAARFAQHWNFGGGTPGQFSRARDVLYQHCADIGRDPAGILRPASRCRSPATRPRLPPLPPPSARRALGWRSCPLRPPHACRAGAAGRRAVGTGLRAPGRRSSGQVDDDLADRAALDRLVRADAFIQREVMHWAIRSERRPAARG